MMFGKKKDDKNPKKGHGKKPIIPKKDQNGDAIKKAPKAFRINRRKRQSPPKRLQNRRKQVSLKQYIYKEFTGNTLLLRRQNLNRAI